MLVHHKYLAIGWERAWVTHAKKIQWQVAAIDTFAWDENEIVTSTQKAEVHVFANLILQKGEPSW